MQEFDAAQQALELRDMQERINKKNRDKELAELLLNKERTTERLQFETERNAEGENLRVAKEEETKRAKEEGWQKYLEEQHQNLRPSVSCDMERKTAVNSAVGTDGDTPETTVMSEHLRLILRQENRT